MPSIPQRLGFSPKISQPVKIRKTGVKERKGRDKDKGDFFKANMYKNRAVISRG
jgi:hypothetical protein